jgi:para-aminobenzoate synthetase component 1
VLNWVQQFGTFCFLDNHQYQLAPHSVECLLGAGAKRSLRCNAGTALTQLQEFSDNCSGFLFGHLAYDLKNEIELLDSSLPDAIGFPDLYFFEPEIVIRLSEKEMVIEAGDPEAIYNDIIATGSIITDPLANVAIRQRLTREVYIDIIRRLQQHILRGDCYEINFCQEFYATNTYVNPLAVYYQLSKISPNPFSALYRVNEQWLMCASPERFLRKEGKQLLSQPIKGTSRRIKDDKVKDEASRSMLHHSEKDRSENVMVVDLVRNDLSKVCREGTVKVDELFGIYSFPQVHQMISTVSGELIDSIGIADILRSCFPMGSMTGAPKKRVMELIEQFEQTKRGIFSGAVGYISPGKDFDFNVVIRSIMYNAATKYLSFQAGSGITFYSDPEQEWEECLVKAAAIKEVLGAKN